MNNRLSPGDLAIIIRSLDNAAVGKIVECISMDGVDPRYGRVWLIRSKSILVTEFGGIGHDGHLPEDWLRKIPNDPLEEEEFENELELST